MVDKSPAEDKLLQREMRVWEPKEHRPTLTWSRSGYKPYSTYVSVPIPILRMLIYLQSQEQVLCVDTYCQGTPVGDWVLMLALYISRTNQKDQRSLTMHAS